MTPVEMDAAILEAVNETQIVNTRSLAFKRWRKIYIRGMCDAAILADASDDPEASRTIRGVADRLERA